MADFRNLNDDELAKYIDENPLSNDIQAAIFEQGRRTARVRAKILCWTTVGAIAAIIAAIAGALMLLR